MVYYIWVSEHSSMLPCIRENAWHTRGVSSVIDTRTPFGDTYEAVYLGSVGLPLALLMSGRRNAGP